MSVIVNIPKVRCASKKSRARVSLPVLAVTGGAHAASNGQHIAKSRTARWRAAVLIAVNAIFIIHIIQWLIVGMTISPVEPSESMQTLEIGSVNAGFVFFLLAILSTAILGRFFCGWGCHIVALQDLCAWGMKRLGVHPRPFRSRLLLFIPLFFALYMFVWPNFRRLALTPLLADAHGQFFAWLVGDTPRFQGAALGFVVRDFWATFPPWYVAIPYFAVVGFAAVYLLGAKGFCTYGCPYGGFFGPADMFALGKIRVTDACEQCGHCTAVCTSNVRVHEEVRDFGMVVDPGCMKCMDCISVCPNDALYFGLGMPTILARPVSPGAAQRQAAKQKSPKRYDLTRPQEITAAVLFGALFLAFRGFLNEVPMLMAIGMAGVGVFLAWKLVSLVRLPNVRIQSQQLKVKGRLRAAGVAFGALAVLTLAAGAWGGAVRYLLWRGDLVDSSISVPLESALAPGYKPDDDSLRDARAAIAFYRRAGPATRAGIGWPYSNALLVRLAYLSAVCAEYGDAEAYLRMLLSRQQPNETLVMNLASFIHLRGGTPEEILAAFQSLAAEHPGSPVPRRAVAQQLIFLKRPAEAQAVYEAAIKDHPASAPIKRDAGLVFMQLDQPERALALFEEAVALAPRDVDILLSVASVYLQTQRPEKALPILQRAAEVEPHSAGIRHDLALVLASVGRVREAADQMKAAAGLDTVSPDVAQRLSEMLYELGDRDASATWRREAERRQAALQAPPKNR